jgi:predicted membrane protein
VVERPEVDDSALATVVPEEDESEETEIEVISTIVGSLERSGDWLVADRIHARAICGYQKLDFTRADLPADGVVEIHCRVLCGQLELIVPEGAEIDMEDLRAIVSDVKHGGARKKLGKFLRRVITGDVAEPRDRPEGEPPLFVITGQVILGGIAVISR